MHWRRNKQEDNADFALECSALLVPAPGAGVWYCWYVQAENSLRKRETHVRTFFTSTGKVNISQCFITSMLHFKLLMKQRKSMSLFQHTNRNVCVQYLHSASNPPMSCSFHSLPYMVKEKLSRQKGRRREKKASEQGGGGRCG